MGEDSEDRENVDEDGEEDGEEDEDAEELELELGEEVYVQEIDAVCLCRTLDEWRGGGSQAGQGETGETGKTLAGETGGAWERNK